MLLAILAIYFNTGAKTFDIVQLAQMRPFSGDWLMQSLAFWAFFIGFAIKVPGVALPHVAARRPRGGAHGGQRHPGRRPAEAGLLRHVPHPAAHLPRRRPGVRPGDRRPGRDQHRLRRAGGHGPERLQEADRLLLGEPHGLCDAGLCRGRGADRRQRGGQGHRPERRRPADVQPRHHHRRLVPPGGRDLRAQPQPRPDQVRRPAAPRSRSTAAS